MFSLETVFFPAPTLRRAPRELIRWWEARRLTFNLAVGAAGLMTLVAVELGLRLPLGLHAPFPWMVVVAYGLLANVGYSFGWVAEALLQRWLRRDTYGLGPALFRHGLVFSVGLTLFPIALVGLNWIARLAAIILPKL